MCYSRYLLGQAVYEKKQLSHIDYVSIYCNQKILFPVCCCIYLVEFLLSLSLLEVTEVLILC